jgi:hypothetical protein
MTAPRISEIDGASPVAVEDASPPPSFFNGGASTKPSAQRRWKPGESSLLGYIFRSVTRQQCPHCQIGKPCNFCASMEAQR